MWLEQNRRGILAISLEKKENLIIFIATVSLFLFTVNKLHQRANYICTKHFNPTRVTMPTRSWQWHGHGRICWESDAAGKVTAGENHQTHTHRDSAFALNCANKCGIIRFLFYYNNATCKANALRSINFVNSVISLKVKKERFTKKKNSHLLLTLVKCMTVFLFV